MKHRARSSKIKYQHGMIPGLRRFLERKLEPLPEVQALIPGRIQRKRGADSAFRVRLQYETETGFKLIAHAPGVVQEVFVVCDQREALRSRLEDRLGDGGVK
ncbi:MAG: hypothetical protein GWN84_18590 [Gammaproteobacteria bacterium]|nr:hypothetical protein [Gammaproteobacteria bacterium]NIR84839.1 hypothetical protein [Gammaproteobacteria bacterium]NIR91553.1 hypothetical protein [Gammaproteobacteria bacterium]NIU05886.1 hypothetical protein [Gammaproteobacteria bacterium]NIV76741.1 hypothetical protein [Gammaproteobacteria bacterium]